MAAVLKESEVDDRIARIESDVAHMRSDMSDMKVDIRELRQRADGTADTFGKIRLEISDLRNEMLTRISQLRDELLAKMSDLEQGLERKINDLERRMIQQSLNDRIWMLLLSGANLAIMAHGFKWI